MEMFWIFLSINAIATSVSNVNADVKQEPGHMQPFGTERPIHNVDEIIGFQDPETFLKSHFFQQKPVKVKHGVTHSLAFDFWTDEYFLNLDIPLSNYVVLETAKKEDRERTPLYMNFMKFVEIYNKYSLYMVNALPNFLQRDVVVPFCLQCPDILNGKILEAMMWFSSGGTSSVVHFDSVDNLNCVYRGTKDFVLVDPIKYEGMVPIDRPTGSYSSIDVDKVDYDKYPGLAQVEYIHAHLEAGDCLYIPYLWIHQVRSYGSNLAVNIWLDHYESLTTNTSTCSKTFDNKITLDTINMTGFDVLLNASDHLHGYIMGILKASSDNTLSGEAFAEVMLPDIAEFEGQALVKDEVDSMKKGGRRLIVLVDTDLDGYISVQDVQNLTSDKVLECLNILKQYDASIESINVKLRMWYILEDETKDRDEL